MQVPITVEMLHEFYKDDYLGRPLPNTGLKTSRFRKKRKGLKVLMTQSGLDNGSVISTWNHQRKNWERVRIRFVFPSIILIAFTTRTTSDITGLPYSFVK